MVRSLISVLILLVHASALAKDRPVDEGLILAVSPSSSNGVLR